MTIWASVNNVLARLDDYPSVSGERVWTRDEVELYIWDGLNAFARQTKCLFDMFYPENIPTAGNYSATWEKGYFESGWVAQGLLGFTGGYWERDYAPAGFYGPVNHTQPWEGDYITTTFALGAHTVPGDTVAVDRMTHNWHRMQPEFTRFFEQNDRSFQTTGGEPWRFSMDRDGLGRLRIVPVGDGQATTYTTSGSFGLLRSAGTEFGTWSPVGTWGTLREIPEHFPMGSPYGIPRRLYADTGNTRMEFFRLVRALEELPARCLKYAEFYACAKCLERDGPGQDLKLSDHFMGRFADGVARTKNRLAEHKRAVVGKIGSTGRAESRPALARLPYRYGRVVRRGY